MDKKPTITFAETDRVEELEEYIDELLDILGHPEALVTDRSTLWDFHVDDARAYAAELSDRLGFKVYHNTYLVDIAEEMKKIELSDE